MEYILELCGLQIECQNTLIVCIYSSERETFIVLIEKLKKDKCKNILIGGDFNVIMLEN